MEEHGIKNFPEFMAGAESVNFRVDVAGTRGGHHSGDRPRGGGQARGTGHKRQHVQQVDPWTGSSKRKISKERKTVQELVVSNLMINKTFFNYVLSYMMN